MGKKEKKAQKKLEEQLKAAKEQWYKDNLASPETIKITPKNEEQRAYLKAMQENDLVVSEGPAGTGKTFLAVAFALKRLKSGEIKKIILTRPAVEAGEELGFLPGDLKDKISPYLRPVFDAITEISGWNQEQLDQMIERGNIEVAPLAYMRGRTLSDAVVILDEAQNTTVEQMKMFITRCGNNTRMIVNGDASQNDLGKHQESGLKYLLNAMRFLPPQSQRESKSALVSFSEKSVIRSPLVSDFVKAFTALEDQGKDKIPPKVVGRQDELTVEVNWRERTIQ